MRMAVTTLQYSRSFLYSVRQSCIKVSFGKELIPELRKLGICRKKTRRGCRGGGSRKQILNKDSDPKLSTLSVSY